MKALLLVTVLLITGVHAAPGLKFERPLAAGPSYTAYLVSYVSDGLTVYAMIAVPKSTAPKNAYPVVIANHGYVPDPRKYGITADGIDSRPGDYYRSVPELFTSRGFLVVLPDYRGHNSSEGFDQIENQNRESIDAYSRDVIALMAKLDEVEFVDTDRVFMWSHSMGGGVSMRALLASNIVKASSFWATMNVDDFGDQFATLDGPVIIQHSRSDQSTEHSNSEHLAIALTRIGRPVTIHSVDSDEHFFIGEMGEQAADRDVEFFLSH